MSYSKLELEITFEGVTSNLSVGGELIRVGRSRRCDVTVRDPSISRTHCSMEMRDGGVVLLDEGSANGTWVDGQR
ncbi:MAG TPA: FHA domain-containing protein, partial [Planctomycetota bacterium]|nr:FHA domain-containing protein [Planctomycetota bacterium]